MDYELYDETSVLLNESHSDTLMKNPWNIESDGSMDNNEEYFDWNPLKIDEDNVESAHNQRAQRKRKLPIIETNNATKINKNKSFKLNHDSPSPEEKKRVSAQNGMFYL